MPSERLDRYTNAIVKYAREFDTDPFLLAALVYEGSGCRPKTPEYETRWGVTRIDLSMHAPHIRNREYRFYTLENSVWGKRIIKISKYPFNQWKLDKIDPNIYFAAAILKVFSLQCMDLDRKLGGAPHRHWVSHWFYGDRVYGNEPEDRVLTIRRRLLDYYRGKTPVPAGSFRNNPLVSPLDGVPRLLIDYFGNKRGDKRGPGHRGIDLSGTTGEPVRSVAPGKVTFAGVDLKGAARSRPMTPEEAALYDRSRLGPGGLWVAVNHDNGLRSIYMHLDSFQVKSGDKVMAGQQLGTLGRSGTVSSGPHLHLEFRVETQPVDPARPLSRVIVNPFLAQELEKKQR
jgi:hypothetical protein